VEFLTEKRKNYNEKEDRSCLNRLLQMVICIFCLFQFLKNLINPKKFEKYERKKNLGKDLVEIFAALLMLNSENFVEG